MIYIVTELWHFLFPEVALAQKLIVFYVPELSFDRDALMTGRDYERLKNFSGMCFAWMR